MFEEHCVLQSMRFPQKLWRIVNECQTGAIRWGANGDTVLLDYKRFQTEYLDARRPIFKTSNITSFIRQLNLYGFRKVTSHSRDPICNSYNPHVHEFLHDNFRADRVDLLSKVCRKTGGKNKCLQYEITKSAEESPRLQTNCVSRLKLCQLALTKTLEQIIQEYRREHEKRPIVMQREDNSLKKITNSQDTVPLLYEVEFNDVPNRKSVLERNEKYSSFLPSNINSSKGKTMSLPWYIATTDKCNLHFNIPDIH
ncbi:Heat shock transcription factor, X-linked member 4 [Formica fusca]